jgi:hypothetical protein
MNAKTTLAHKIFMNEVSSKTVHCTEITGEFKETPESCSNVVGDLS